MLKKLRVLLISDRAWHKFVLILIIKTMLIVPKRLILMYSSQNNILVKFVMALDSQEAKTHTAIGHRLYLSMNCIWRNNTVFILGL